MGVDLRFRGYGLGKFLVGYAVGFARRVSTIVGCRYLTLDAQPDLARWYEEQGFKVNKVVQKQKTERAQQANRKEPTVSMRFDLRKPE